MKTAKLQVTGGRDKRAASRSEHKRWPAMKDSRDLIVSLLPWILNVHVIGDKQISQRLCFCRTISQRNNTIKML